MQSFRKAKTAGQILKQQQRDAKRAQKDRERDEKMKQKALERDKKTTQKALEKDRKRTQKMAKAVCKGIERKSRRAMRNRPKHKRSKHSRKSSHKKVDSESDNDSKYRPTPVTAPTANNIVTHYRPQTLTDKQKQIFTIYGFIAINHIRIYYQVYTNIRENEDIVNLILTYYSIKPGKKQIKSSENESNKYSESSDAAVAYNYGNYIYDYFYKPTYDWFWYKGHIHNNDDCLHCHGSDKDHSYDDPSTGRGYHQSYTSRSDHGCIDGKGMVLMGDNTFKLIEELNVNDEIRSFSGGVSRIIAVMITEINRDIKMVNLNDCWVTYKHPIITGTEASPVTMSYEGMKDGLDNQQINVRGLKWVFPKDVCKVEMRYEEKVYNFVLDREHMINVNGNWCVTLGDGYDKGKDMGCELWSDMQSVRMYLSYHMLNDSDVTVKMT